jgi:hypothetical protein
MKPLGPRTSLAEEPYRSEGDMPRTARFPTLIGATSVALAVVVACAPEPQADYPRNPAAFDEKAPYEPVFDPANFSDPQPNPYFPLEPGTRTVFEGGDERVEVTVTGETKEIAGVTATVVTDRVYANGELIEDTVDWYATDNVGNVWYLGEETAEYENGQVVTTAGSWEALVDGAQPGIIMLFDPRADDAYRQEFYAGEAEDVAMVFALDETVSVPTGRYEHVLVTEDWSLLDPDVHERKWYAQGVGVVFEEIVAGGSGSLELVEVGPAD